jgi:hypothetical protein
MDDVQKHNTYMYCHFLEYEPMNTGTKCTELLIVKTLCFKELKMRKRGCSYICSCEENLENHEILEQDRSSENSRNLFQVWSDVYFLLKAISSGISPQFDLIIIIIIIIIIQFLFIFV